MVSEGLAETRTRAQALILAGEVLVDDVAVTKAGAAVRAEATLRLRSVPRQFVSRGGEKLAGALDALEIDVATLHGLDLGASTGGFCDCLLQRGAAHVVAVDVGYGQLHPTLRRDPRVTVRERCNARFLDRDPPPGRFDLVVADLSFISLRLVLPALAAIAPSADFLLLVKPQFEVGRDQVGKGGVVRDDGLRHGAVDRVAACASELGWREIARVESVLAGPKGNRELFLHLKPEPQ